MPSCALATHSSEFLPELATDRGEVLSLAAPSCPCHRLMQAHLSHKKYQHHQGPEYLRHNLPQITRGSTQSKLFRQMDRQLGLLVGGMAHQHQKFHLPIRTLHRCHRLRFLLQTKQQDHLLCQLWQALDLRALALRC